MTERMKKKFKYRTEHLTQEVIEDDQFTTVCFKVKNPLKMIPWVMKYGPYVEVVKPEEMRNEMKKNVQTIAALYE